MTGGARIVGVGQPFAGDDGVGPAVIAFLRGAGLPAGVEVGEVREPSALIPLLDDERPMVIVDAVLAAPAGAVLDLDAGAVESGGLTSVSSHGLSVGAALSLARASRPADRPPPDVRVVAVAIGSAVRGARGLSAPVEAAVPRAARLALERATRAGGR
jgi:hydrogenase maturation protease